MIFFATFLNKTESNYTKTTNKASKSLPQEYPHLRTLIRSLVIKISRTKSINLPWCLGRDPLTALAIIASLYGTSSIVVPTTRGSWCGFKVLGWSPLSWFVTLSVPRHGNTVTDTEFSNGFEDAWKSTTVVLSHHL